MDANLSGFLGVIIGSLIIFAGSFLTNYFQLKVWGMLLEVGL